MIIELIFPKDYSNSQFKSFELDKASYFIYLKWLSSISFVFKYFLQLQKSLISIFAINGFIILFIKIICRLPWK